MSQENEVLFREVQDFKGKLRLIHIFLAIAIAGTCFAVTVAIIKNPDKSLGSILSTAGGVIITVGLAVLFMVLKLETEVRSDGLYVRYFPFHLKFKKINPEDLSEYAAREYSPLWEYGGWGIKCGKSGKAYNVKGNRGLQLVFNNGKRLLIGSQKSDELEQALHSLTGD